jgi:hypothetical protein
MKLLAGLGTLAFIVVGAIVGARLLLLARRTGQRPELYIGGALFIYAFVAQPAIVASRPIGAALGQEARLAVLALGLFANGLTILGLYAFTAEVFRRESRLAWCIVWSTLAIELICGIVILSEVWTLEIGAPYTLTMKCCVALICVIFSAGMAWIAVESLRYHGLLKKRLALGLADPVLVNRFALWGAGCLACALLSLGIIVCVGAGMNVVSDPVPRLLTATAGSWIAISWYLSMLAPPAYLRWVRERAQPASSES